MENHNCLFQVSLFKNDRLLVSFDWTADKDAVIEAMDSINARRSVDVEYRVVEHDHRRAVLVVVKNGHTLLTTTPFDMKPFPDEVREVLSGRVKLRAALVTKGSGGVDISNVIKIGG